MARLLETTTPRSSKPFHMIDTIVDFCLEPSPNGRHWKVALVFGTKTAIDLRTPPSEKLSMTIHHQNAHQYYLRRRRRRRTVYLKHLALDLNTAGTCAVKKKFEQVASAVASAIPDPVSFVVARNVGIPWLSRGLSIRCTWRRNGRRPLTVTCQLVLLMMVVFLFNGAFAMPTLSDSRGGSRICSKSCTCRHLRSCRCQCGGSAEQHKRHVRARKESRRRHRRV